MKVDLNKIKLTFLTDSVRREKMSDERYITEESSNYIKYQILQQATASLLSTANQQPSIALNLI